MTELVEVNTRDLSGTALDWAVAKVEGVAVVTDPNSPSCRQMVEDADSINGWYCYCPSTDWSDGGPLIEKYKLDIGAPLENKNGHWNAATEWAHPMGYKGDTPLIAACRAIVASVLGDTVTVPKELLS